MRMAPRQQLLGIWRATARVSFHEQRWLWGGRDGPNSISDAEQLLSLMLPATSLELFKLDCPDETANDVIEALRVLGAVTEIPRLLIRVLTEYMEKYTDESGTPVFFGDGYFTTTDGGAPSEEQAALDVVDSFTMSVTLSLAAIGFARVFQQYVRREDLRGEIVRLERLASARLSAAMIGLLRSFTVYAFDASAPEGRTLVGTVNQSGLPHRQVAEELWHGLREVRAALRSVTIGSAGPESRLDDPNRLFECGWSWGIVRGAPVVETAADIGKQPAGVAEAAPYLYFSVVALDGIAGLFSERTRILGLLNEEQQRLASALQLRWDITQQYWSTIASFGSGRWPLEDIPWRTTDAQESDYFSLLVTAMTVQDLVRRRAPDVELDRVGRILDELAHRARITRRPFAGDPAVALHTPGVVIDLNGSEELGPTRLTWACADFSPLLFKRTVLLAGLMRDTGLRGQLLTQADAVWDHLLRRSIKDGPARNLWDQVGDVFGGVDSHADSPSWYYTERVVECVVAAASVLYSSTLKSDRLTAYARELVNEADHLFDQELLGGWDTAGPAVRDVIQKVQANLRRAREIIDDRPGTAAVLANTALQDLDSLAVARQDVSGYPQC
jgi:hypothetical protein